MTENVELFSENNAIRKFTGVDKFHNAGYYGERVYAATGEDWSIENYNPDALVEIPFGDGKDWGNLQPSGHGSQTAGTFFQVAPKAHLVQMSQIHKARTGKNRYCGLKQYCIPIIEQYNITACFCSFSMIYDKYLAEKYQEVFDYFPNFNLVVSAGNDSLEDYNDVAKDPNIVSVGAYYISNNKAKVESFTSLIPEYIDFGAPDRQTVKFANKTNITEYGKLQGTSFSAPWLCGMMCLINDFFIDKTGKPLTREAMYQFLVDYSVDVGDEGFDSAMGYGAAVLPDPSEIDISKYTDTTLEDNEDEEQIDMEVTTDNTKQPFDIITMKEYNAVCERIPFSSIEKIDIARCNEPKETLQLYYDRQEVKPDILINGGLFNLKTGENILSIVDEGVEYGEVIGYQGFGVHQTNVNKVEYGLDNTGEWVDFIAAYPILYKEGRPTTEFEWSTAVDISSPATRQVIAYDDNNFYILTVDNKVDFLTVQKMLTELGVEYALNLDGGGSTRTMRFGKVTNNPTENRPVDNVLAVYLRDAQTVPEMGQYTAVQNANIMTGVESNAKVIATIPAWEVFNVTSYLEYNEQMWLVGNYNGKYGFILYDDKVEYGIKLKPDDSVDKPTEPEEPENPVTVAPNVTPGLYECLQDNINCTVGVEEGSHVITTIRLGDIVELTGSSLVYNGKAYTTCKLGGNMIGFVEYSESIFQPFVDEPLVPDEPEEPTVILPAIYRVTAETSLNIQATPGGEIIDVLFYNYKIVVDEIVDTWAKFRHTSGTAYVSTKYIEYVSEYEEIKPEPDEPVVDTELDYSVLNKFTDKDNVSAWAKDGVTFCVQNSILAGTSDTTLSPKDNVTREQLCSIIYRIMNKGG